MAWVKIDDAFYRHEKRWEVDLDGIGLFLLMLCYCNDRLTDGYVPKRFVEANVQAPDRRGTVKSLVEAGLVTPAAGGFQIPDYLEYQPSREQVLERREKRAEAGRRGGQASAKAKQSAKQVAKQSAKQNVKQVAKQTPSKPATPYPVGIRDVTSARDENEHLVATPTENDPASVAPMGEEAA